MATNYPGAVDSFTNPLSSEPMNGPSHAGQHANANDAVEAIETELGTDPSGSAATVKARLDGIEDGTRLGTNSVGAAQIANDSVDTAAIQDGAVTPVKLARPIGNMLTDNQASAGRALGNLTGLANWDSTATYLSYAGEGGVGGVQLVNVAGGMTFDGHVPVTAGREYTAFARVSNNSGTHVCSGSLWFYDANGDPVGQGIAPYKLSSGNSFWSDVVATKIAPPTAVAAKFYLHPPQNETLSVTAFGLWEGVGGDWAMPGRPIMGLQDVVGNILSVDAAHGVSSWTVGGEVTYYPGLGPSAGFVNVVNTEPNTFAIPHVRKAGTAPFRSPVAKAGQVWTGRAEVSGLTANAQGTMFFADANGETTSSFATNIVQSGSSGTLEVTAVAPPNTIEVCFAVYCAGAVRIDKPGLWQGAGGTWALPGVPITNQGRKVTHPNTDDVLVQHWDDGRGRWQVTHYDSGWRDMSGSLINGWNSGFVRIRRVNATVSLKMGGVKGSADITTPLLMFPSGFAESQYAVPGTVFREDVVTGKGGWLQAGAGRVNLWGGLIDGSAWSASYGISLEYTFSTDDAIPTSLPGTLHSAATY